MTRWLTALLGCLFLAGCPQLPPVPPEPPSPPDLPVVPDEVSNDPEGAAEQIRHHALRVMASEQRNVVNALDQQTRFVRAGGGTLERVRAAVVVSARELSSIDRAIDELGRNDSLSSEARHEREDELKERLRRLASRLALMETVLREG